MSLEELYVKWRKQDGDEDIMQFIKFCRIECELDSIRVANENIKDIQLEHIKYKKHNAKKQ